MRGISVLGPQKAHRAFEQRRAHFLSCSHFTQQTLFDSEPAQAIAAICAVMSSPCAVRAANHVTLDLAIGADPFVQVVRID